MSNKIANQEIQNFGLFNTLSLDSRQIRARIRKWIKALESGSYQQGAGQLEIEPGKSPTAGKDEDRNNLNVSRFCCLGIANKICTLGKNGCDGTLYGVNEKMGLCDGGGEFEDGVGGNSLYYLNDRDKWTFAEIANFIKDQYNVVMRERKQLQRSSRD